MSYFVKCSRQKDYPNRSPEEVTGEVPEKPEIKRFTNMDMECKDLITSRKI